MKNISINNESREQIIGGRKCLFNFGTIGKKKTNRYKNHQHHGRLRNPENCSDERVYCLKRKKYNAY